MDGASRRGGAGGRGEVGGGGGGGVYFGGCGGGGASYPGEAAPRPQAAGGGGGGSSWAKPRATPVTWGTAGAHGYIEITYTTPGGPGGPPAGSCSGHVSAAVFAALTDVPVYTLSWNPSNFTATPHGSYRRSRSKPCRPARGPG